MKHIILTSALLISNAYSVNSQVIDTVTMGPSYANNIWYSLENDNQAWAPNNNWDLAFSTSFSQLNELTTALHFNPKVGNVYEVLGSSVASFDAIDTVGLHTWTPLFNSELTWSKGALNNTTTLGQFDYGWGSYDAVNHSGINANRVFVIQYLDQSIVKFYINMNFSSSKYLITYADLENTAVETTEIVYSDYDTKNFIYLDLKTGLLIDREPASSTWDFLFTHYPTNDYNPPYLVTGVLQNIHTEVAKVYPIENTADYDNWSNASFSEEINGIGWNWKVLNAQYTYDIEDSTVYFVKTQTGDLWKVIMKEFIGSSAGKFIFSKEKIETASVGKITGDIGLSLYPNPANEMTKLLVSQADQATVTITNNLGQQVFTSFVNGNELQSIALPTANWRNGVYYVSIRLTQGKTVKKLVIQH